MECLRCDILYLWQKNWLVWPHSNITASCLLNYHRSIPTTKKNILVYMASNIVKSLNVFNTFVVSPAACEHFPVYCRWLQCSVCLLREMGTFPPSLAWLSASLCYWLYFLTICSFLAMDCFRSEIVFGTPSLTPLTWEGELWKKNIFISTMTSAIYNLLFIPI